MADEPRALYPPANHERLAPDELPKVASVFHRWAGFACVEWPDELEAHAFRAGQALLGRFRHDPGAVDRFWRAYAEWYVLPEDEKLVRMGPYRRDGRRRDFCRRRARAQLNVQEFADILSGPPGQ